MVASKFDFIFLIILSLQLSAALLLCNGMSMTLHRRRSLRGGMRVKEPLYYNVSEYEYYMELSVGTPPQDLPVTMDTGSNVVWAACTPTYTCTLDPYPCSGSITVFLPNKSSSALPVQCADPKCRDVCKEGGWPWTTCPDKCSGKCPDYFLTYGSASSVGHLLTDTLSLPSGSGQITNFTFGCSVASDGTNGIAGFGKGNLSLPSQLSASIGDKFAYCLNDQNTGSMVVLGDKAVRTNMTLKYTPFLTNSKTSYQPYKELYYLGLKGVSIGGKSLTLPSNVSTIDIKGNGGTVIDSGTTYTQLPQEVADQIAAEFASQIAYPSVKGTVEGFGPCYNVSGVANANIKFPEFAFRFGGSSDMVLPQGNIFMQVKSDIYCSTLQGYSGNFSNGPAAVILGSYQQRNLYILYDREMNRLGFTQQAC